MFNEKHWYSYDELRDELLRESSHLNQNDILLALNYMEENGHDEADFGIMGRFIYSRKKQELEQ